MNNIAQPINPQPIRGLYLVSFDDWEYDQYDAFLVVACSEEEADQLTPDYDVNCRIGIKLGYDCPKPAHRRLGGYSDPCQRGKSIRRIGDAGAELGWGEVPISSFNAG